MKLSTLLPSILILVGSRSHAVELLLATGQYQPGGFFSGCMTTEKEMLSVFNQEATTDLDPNLIIRISDWKGHKRVSVWSSYGLPICNYAFMTARALFIPIEKAKDENTYLSLPIVIRNTIPEGDNSIVPEVSQSYLEIMKIKATKQYIATATQFCSALGQPTAVVSRSETRTINGLTEDKKEIVVRALCTVAH